MDTETRDRDWQAGKTKKTYKLGLGSARVKIPAAAVRTSRAVLAQATAEAIAAQEMRADEGEQGPAADPAGRVLVTRPVLVKRVARIEGWKVSETSSDGRRNRRTERTEAERREGGLDDRFREEGDGVTAQDLAELQKVLQPTPAEAQMRAEDVLTPWSAERVSGLARKGAAHNTAPGPTGLTHAYLAEALEEVQETMARVIGASQATGVRPEAWRRAFEWPVPKPGAGGATLDGARRICLVEVAAKMLDGEISRAVSEEWRKRGTLHPWQGGFTKHRGAGEMAAACVSVLDKARRGPKPMYVVFADVAKAFPSVPHWAVEQGLRRTAVPDKVLRAWMEAERGRESGKLTAVQMLTDWGPTEDIEAEGGLLMGQSGSPAKWLAFIDGLLRWLDACGVVGVEVRKGGPRTAAMAFADDLAIMVPGTIKQVQRALHLVDKYLRLFGVDLQPDKSIVMKVGGAGTAAGQQWLEEERLYVERPEGRQELRRAGRREGVRYLGAMLQADGKWGAAERDLKRKVQAWCSAVERADVTVGQAARLLQSSVGGLVQYLAQATGIGEACYRAVDRRVGMALGRKVKLPRWMGSGTDRTAAVFTPAREGGMGMESAVTRQRKVVVGSVLTWLNRAMLGGVDSSPLDDVWLEAWREEVEEQGGAVVWNQEAGSKSRRGDLMAACRVMLGKMGLEIRDTRPLEARGPQRRRRQDAALMEMLAAATAAEMGMGREVNEVENAVELERARRRAVLALTDLRCLGELVTIDGLRLHKWSDLANTAGRSKQPLWFSAIEAMCVPALGTRQLPPWWRCSPVGQEASEGGAGEDRPVGRSTRQERPTEKADSAVRVVRRAAMWRMGGEVQVEEEGAGLPEVTVREGERWGYVGAPSTGGAPEDEPGEEVEMELVSDGTGGGRTAGLAWASTWQEGGAQYIRGTGWVPGAAESDRSELGGLIQQLKEVLRVAAEMREAGRQLVLARLLTDCEGAMRAVEWAATAPTGRVLRHKNRVLLLEWKGVMAEVTAGGTRVELGWIKGHTERKEWPYPVQDWCDRHAGEANAQAERVEAEERLPSSWDAPFLLWDSARGAPVWGGWGQEVVQRSEQELAVRARQATSTAAGWMRMRAAAFTRESEWDARPLEGKHGAEARARIGAQWDTVFVQGRWEEEEAARKAGTLEELERRCQACRKTFKGRRETHDTEQCEATEAARAFTDGVAGGEIVRQMAYDPAVVQRAWDRWRVVWTEMQGGVGWQGFRAAKARLPGKVQPPRAGVGAKDGDPTVFSLAQKKAAVRRWKDAHPERREEESIRPAAVVDVAVDEAGTQVLPIVLFLLFERWRKAGKPVEGFSRAVAEAVKRERERADSVVDGRRVGQDAWAWPGCFVEWVARHAPAGQAVQPVAVLFTGLINHAGEPTPGCTAEKDDAAWGMATDAWWTAPGVERRWGTGETEARVLQGNPPYDERSVRRFCQYAQRAAVPVTGVLPVLPGAARARVEREITSSGGRHLAKVAAGDMRFVPVGFWTGHEGRGGGEGCGTQSATVLVEWGGRVTPAAEQELKELLLAAGKRGKWPSMGGGGGGGGTQKSGYTGSCRWGRLRPRRPERRRGRQGAQKRRSGERKAQARAGQGRAGGQAGPCPSSPH